MKTDVVDEILEVEAEAKQILEKAKADAHECITDAQLKAAKILKDAVDKVKKEHSVTLENAMEVYQKEIDDYKAKKLSENNSGEAFNNGELEIAAKKIVDTICYVAL